MAITVQALQADGTWGVRSAFTTENAKVRAGSMTAADLEAIARATMSKWQQTSCDGKQLRVHNSDNEPKTATRIDARAKAETDARALGWMTTWSATASRITAWCIRTAIGPLIGSPPSSSMTLWRPTEPPSHHQLSGEQREWIKKTARARKQRRKSPRLRRSPGE